MPIITSNVIHRTFLIRWNDSIGTGFALDLGSRQYLVTARHVVADISSGNTIDIFYNEGWKKLPVNVVGIGKDDVDVAVLACFCFNCLRGIRCLRQKKLDSVNRFALLDIRSAGMAVGKRSIGKFRCHW